MNSHLFKTIDGVQVRKGKLSGAGNDCTYLTPPDAVRPFAYDSKSEQTLSFGTKARRSLVAAVSAGTFVLAGILALSVDNPGMTHDCVSASDPGMTHNCAINW